MSKDITNNFVHNFFNSPVNVGGSFVAGVGNILEFNNIVGDLKTCQSSTINLEDLKKHLLYEAKKKCKLPDTGNIKGFAGYVPLQMGFYKQEDKKSELGHFDSRQEILTSYEKLLSEDNLLPEDFFSKSVELVTQSDEFKRALTEEAKEHCLSKLSNVVGVIGQAGAGKSTFLRFLLGRIVGEEKLYQADYIFLVDLRDFYEKSEMSLFEFLIGDEAFECMEWLKDKDTCSNVLKHLAESDSVCILLDGLDEIEVDVNDESEASISPYCNQLPSKFVLGLLRGQILPKAKKIITSRPGQMLDLPEHYQPNLIVRIFGITQEGIDKICHNICGDSSSTVLNQIKNQPDLHSYTRVPIHCVLIIHCIYSFLQGEDVESLPNNITDVFVLSFFHFAETKHMLQNSKSFNIKNLDHLKNISFLAWLGIEKQQFYFNDHDLEAAGLSNANISSVTLTVKRPIKTKRLSFLLRATSNCTYFAHLLVQEFFAALYCLFFMESQMFQNIFFDSKQCDLQSNRFLMVTKFLFGLSNPETLDLLRDIYPNISNQAEHLILLKEFAKNFATTITSRGYKGFSNLDYYDKFRSILNICSWVYEIQDLVFCQQISDTLPTDIVVCEDILPNDVLSFWYVMKVRSKSLYFDVGGENCPAKFVGNALLQFLEEARSAQTKLISKIHMEDLQLNRYTIDESHALCIGSCISNGGKLILKECQVKKSVFEELFKSLNGKCLKTVKFKDIAMSDETVQAASNLIVEGTMEIHFWNCDLTAEGIQFIIERLSSLTHSVDLCIMLNKIGSAGFKSVAECIDQVDDLAIGHQFDQDLTLDDFKMLIDAVFNRPTCMKNLSILCPSEMGPEVRQEMLHLEDKVEMATYNNGGSSSEILIFERKKW